MEHSEFSQAIESYDVLKAQSSEVWDQLSEKYPFATLINVLYAQKEDSLTREEAQKLFVYMDNPLHMSMLLSAKKTTITEKEIAVNQQETSKKTSRIVSYASSLKSEKLEKSVEHVKSDTSEPSQPLEKESAPLEEKVKKERTVAKGENDEDVLQLIQDLPEENLIPNIEHFASTIDDQDESEAEFNQEQDPGDLMVMMSFTDWLQYFKTKKENEAEDRKGRDAIRSAWQKEKLAEAMDDDEDVVPDEIFKKAMKSVSFGDGLVTESLAELYAQQGKTEKAIELYKKLSLFNPEKKVYFASRIKELHLLK